MSNSFLAKELNRKKTSAVCINIQKGALSTQIHWHDCAEIIHLRQGVARLFLKDRWVTLNEGETAFIPQGEPHCCHCTDKTALRVVVGITEELLGSDGNKQEEYLFPFSKDSACRRVFEKTENLSKLFSLLKEGTKTKADELQQRFFTGLIYSEIFNILENEGLCTNRKPKSDNVKKVELIIKEKYNENITAEDIAKSLNLSYSHMAKLLREECSSSFGEMLFSYRIDTAKKLLLTTDKSITEIAFSVGFCDSSYFIKRFGERVGLTPFKYREKNLSLIDC